MNILYFSDQLEHSSHTSVEAIFNKYLKDFADVTVVYFSKERKTAFLNSDNHLILPFSLRKKAAQEASKLLDVQRFDVVIVRNFLNVLSSVLAMRQKYNFKVGFQLSFPHLYRRYYQAKQENRAILRKTIEYVFKNWFQKRLLDKCDFFIPISKQLVDLIYPGYLKSVFPLGTGVDFSKLPPTCCTKSEGMVAIKKFVYIGTIDSLRGLDTILAGFTKADANRWKLDFFTPHTEIAASIVGKLSLEVQSKISIYKSLPRDELLQKISCEYDCGISLIPETPLYLVSSPTKTMEYYACCLPVLMSRLPSHIELFSGCGWFSSLDSEEIAKKINEIIFSNSLTLSKMGMEGRDIVNTQCNYSSMAFRLADFLQGQRR